MRTIALIATGWLLVAPAMAQTVPTVRHVGSDPATGASAAVLVGDLPLVHTAQLLPVDKSGKVVAAGDAAAQLDRLLDELDSILQAAGSDLSQVAKLNLYLAREEAAAVIGPRHAARFPSEARPAVSLVVTALPLPDALVALDAVAAAPVHAAITDVKRTPQCAILPAGSRLYVSGPAEPGALREAARKTLESLTASLAHCGRTDRDVVQLKCFLTPMSSVAEVQEEIARHFGEESTPSVSFVEWRSTLPIEIELVAWAGPAKADAQEPLEFITPPALKPSPLFSRVARIHRGGSIFFSDLFGPPSASADEQAKEPFEKLVHLLEKTGSDLKHLAKATYYVTDDEVSKAHNAIRPKYYDPSRPPAASKALVAATGRPESRYSMDMIAAASSRGTPASGPEHGKGLTAEEAAAGWISLFDGAIDFGWKGARVENGRLIGGTTAARVPRCQLSGGFAGSGTIVVGGRGFVVKHGQRLLLVDTGASGPIRMGDGVAVESLVVRPLGLTPLVNGRDLAGWKSIRRAGPSDEPDPYWRAELGVLRAVGGPGAIEYAGELFGDLVLQIDVRSRAVHSNGGVFFRSVPGQFMNGYEAQLHNRCLDDDPARTFRYATGGLDDRQDARRLASRDFESFRMTIIADGPHIATWVNGVQTTDWTDERPPHENPREGQRLAAGSLQLQAHDPATDFEVRQVLVTHLK